MKVANYTVGGRLRAGLVEGDDVYDISSAAAKIGAKELETATADELIAHGRLAQVIGLAPRLKSAGAPVPLKDVKLSSPVLAPEKILLAAVNYVSHGDEQEVKPPSEPYFFTKFRNALVGDGDEILIPRNSSKVDWEVELAAIVGKKGKFIPRSGALDHIAGFAVSNDVSFRDLQFPKGWPDKLSPLGQNWVQGKGLDNSFPLGPWLVTPDELGDLRDLELTLKVNGRVMQQASTSDMVFGVDDLVAYVSQGITLMPGDVISTGTPKGVAVFSGAPFLKGGDAVEASISGIGTLHNGVRAEAV
jgi:2-keto-4-pentenoate hydratase/2-oxohepta-3-ene-1,7-dioic acid hydratase in catechol pathway